MLTNFIKKKRKVSAVKISNIEHIQGEIIAFSKNKGEESKNLQDNNTKPVELNNSVKIFKSETPKKTKKNKDVKLNIKVFDESPVRECKISESNHCNPLHLNETADKNLKKINSKKTTKTKKLEDYSFISESSFLDVSLNKIEALTPGYRDEEPELFSRSNEDQLNVLGKNIRKSDEESQLNVLDKNSKTESISQSNEQSKNIDFSINHTSNGVKKDSLDTRKLKVMNHATRNVEIGYSLANVALHLPKELKNLSVLYKIIRSVFEFNQRRDLTLIFAKYVDSIERLFKHRVETSVLEQLNYICNGAIIFTPLTIFDEAVRKETFTIHFKGEFDIDLALFNFYIELYRKWLNENDIKGKIIRFHPDFIQQEIEIPKKPFLIMADTKPEEVVVDIRKIAKAKSDSIIERIKEKERLRKEQFIMECTVKKDYLEMINNLFLISNKRALKLEDLIFKIGGFDCKANLLKCISGKYIVKNINGEDYVMKQH